MPLSDIALVFQWWGTLFLVGAAAYPFTEYLFQNWFDRGYLFAKAVGLAMVTFLVYAAGMFHLVPFTQGAVWGALIIVGIWGTALTFRRRETKQPHTLKHALFLIGEEVFFFAALLSWTWVKAHEPSIHNLEKYMDFGFTKSILDSTYFPPTDMWYAGLPINYYYFGHTVMAMLTRLSGIDLTYAFNLMLATIFAFTFTMSFSIGVQLLKLRQIRPISRIGQLAGGALTAFLVTLAGNMQTIYAFTQGYDGDQVKPFWQLLWPIADIWQKLPQGLNRYWYANATRFIPYTIHEFPSYSFVVSDVHGHVLSLPFVLLAMALLIAYFGFPGKEKQRFWNYSWLLFYGLLCGVLLMTNATDGPIYFGLFIVILAVRDYFSPQNNHADWVESGKQVGVALVAASLASVPFISHFKSFVNGIAVNCPPAALANLKVGPILFEGVEKCQHSPIWMMWLLWGFFIFCGLFILVPFVKKLLAHKMAQRHELVLGVWFVICLFLIIFPEFFYFKDIYPMHFRSNTMFKLGYQAFIMFSIISGYAIMTVKVDLKGKIWKRIFYVFLIPQLFLVSIYPIFSVRSYFDSLRQYEGIFGMSWFERQYPDDWAGIVWLNQEIFRRKHEGLPLPVIVEADGDSYTDYDRFSAFTGVPTVIGWPVHEWLWRGSYDVVAPRRGEVGQIYESTDLAATKAILAKYHITYIIVGTLERQKFKALQEAKLAQLGKQVFASGMTVIYEVH